MDKLPKSKKILYYLIYLSVLLVITLMLGETYVRLFSRQGYLTPNIQKKNSLQYVPSLYARHLFPEQEQTIKGAYNNILHISNKGYRGNDFKFEKDSNVTRIIIYGGSAVFDQAATEGKDWPHLVEKLLNERGFSVEVINAGIPGHTSIDSFERLFLEGHLFDPDYVAVYNAWNDIKYFKTKKPLLRIYKPYDESQDPFQNYQGWLDRFLCEHSQFYVRVRNRYFRWKLNIDTEGVKKKVSLSSEFYEIGLRQYKLNMEMFVDCARNIGATPILITQARLVSKDNTAADRNKIIYEYTELTHEALLKAFEQCDQILYQVAKEKEVHIIDASKAMTGKSDFFIDHVHLTPKGSSMIAEIVAQNMTGIMTSDMNITRKK
ncbi:MAG: GDSL-type esterase/lipase family protein [candidate division KSB1 bacterium]|nr:GDSL-type esterase/lipase family protein [candidate division KSB1 bacterium]MDZ7376149.1 GDSL-type esterase/lipase family protein [candidate division KSB1 bacterium]MDZ7399651.1 GDSL-type esterase/lipase family protein [candidate division KSB1 bacterium]